MNIEQIQLVHEDLVAGRIVDAANLALAADGIEETTKEPKEALAILKTLEQNLADEGRYAEVAVLLWGNEMFDSRPSVVKDVFREVAKNNKLIIFGGSSLSKCLGPEVRVRMFDGSTKKAKDVMKGDVLMGDDSGPRNVLDTHRGSGPLYEIVPDRGESWICNEHHILSLRQGAQRWTHGRPSGTWIKGNVYDIPMKEYMGYSKFRKSCLKQFSVGVEYPKKQQEYDPYIYGAWLGDGCAVMGHLASPPCALTDKWKSYFESIGMFVREYRHTHAKCSSWTVSAFEKIGNYKTKRNKWRAFIRTSVDEDGKFIRPEYLFGDRQSRIMVLAGLIDTDGCVIDKGTAYKIGVTPPRLARQILELARSVGFGSHIYKNKPSKWSKKPSYCVTITGQGIEEIPTVDRKVSRISSRTTTNVGIREIRPIGNGTYHGFLIDGNHRFLLSDYTVTHNTFSCGVWMYISWRSDPYWTSIKLAGPSEDHLRGNLFSHLCALHRGAALPMTEDDKTKVVLNETDLFISMSDALPEMCIQGVLCKQGQITATGLRGHKPKTYRKPHHPKYKNLTRLYILIDEATNVSPGAFEDIKTTEMSINPELDNVKIVMTCNPEGVDYKVVKLAEPPGGWEPDQVDSLYTWVSEKGYPCLRLDAKNFENIVQRRVIYPNMATYESYIELLKGGEDSGSYWAKGRGFPPLKDNAWTLVPPAWMHSQRGEPIFIGKVKNVAIVDTALGGADKALMGIARFGEASGWRKMDGAIEWFVNRAKPDLRKTKHCAVLDQIFTLPKSPNTVEVVSEVMGRCKKLEVAPENTAFDKTGNAGGVWSHAKTFWGDVLGIDFGSKASDSRILAEHQMTAYDLCDGKVTELWVAAKNWLDPVVGALFINPIVPTTPLFSQMTTRRYRNVKGGKVRVEPKEEYRSRNGGQSPDEADILCMLVEWCRQRGGIIPGIEEKANRPMAGDGERASLENADEPDTLGTNAEWEPNRLDAE